MNPIFQTISEPLHQKLQDQLRDQASLAPSKPKPVGERQAAAAIGQSPAPPVDRTPAYRPPSRQPLALLTVFDDGLSSGEVVRIRQDCMVIGREEGDVRIPFDLAMSRQHAQLTCHFNEGKCRWVFKDLQSTNGSFVRVYRARLSADMELAIGTRRYLFKLAPQAPASSPSSPMGTVVFGDSSGIQASADGACLVEVATNGMSSRTIAIERQRVKVGADPQRCEAAIDEDSYVNPVHAEIYRDERGHWMIDDLESRNGVWIRVKQLTLTQQAEFQLGQQRFLFQP